MSKEIGYLFKPHMRDKIRHGLKWQTRRLRGLEEVNKKPEIYKSAYQDAGGDWIFWTTNEPGLEQFTKENYKKGKGFKCPFGKPGDRMYVKEPTRVLHMGEGDRVLVEWADFKESVWVDITEQDLKKLQSRDDWSKPSSAMFMLKSFARTKRSLVSVRPVILQEISEEDAIAEGVHFYDSFGDIHYRNYQADASAFGDPISSFGSLWNSINKEHQWDDRPWWVWRIEWAKEVSE